MRQKSESWDMVEKNSPVIIHWARHAESCSNVEITELDSDMDTLTIVQSVSTKLLQKTSQPPLSELGIFQAIEFGKFIHNDPIVDNEINPKFNIDTFESIYADTDTLAEPRDKFFVKYLKYKLKYEKLKKQLILSN